MTAPTPGPWTFRPGRYGSPHVISWAPGKSYGQIAQINTPSFAELPEAKLADEVEANARLIASAPLLLCVLKEVAAAIEEVNSSDSPTDVTDCLPGLLAAIQKAEDGTQ